MEDENEDDVSLEDEVTYKMWDSTDRTEMKTVVSSLEEFYDVLCEKIDDLTTHSFIAKSQGSYLKLLKETLDDETAIVTLDFAENYQYVYQHEVQSYHWCKKYCSLHPVVLYIKVDGQLECVSMCVLSDDLKHDTVFVHKVMEIAAEYCKTNHPHIKKFEYFSDGCAEQYKNFKHFMNICRHSEDFDMEVVAWNFFATSHGKGACDGIGGTVKRLARLESLRRDGKNGKEFIDSFPKFYQYCVDNIKNIVFHKITAFDLEQARPVMNARYEHGDTVPGTRSFHQFIPSDVNVISYKRLSCDAFNAGSRNFSSLPVRRSYSVGRYVAAVYDLDWYIGLIEEQESPDEYLISYMHPKNPRVNLNWPSRPDRLLTPTAHILCEIEVPAYSSTTARVYHLKESDHTEITRLFSNFVNGY